MHAHHGCSCCARACVAAACVCVCQVLLRVKRERMVDLMAALDDGEDLSELLAPRT